MANNYWTNGGGDNLWSTDANWSVATAPVAADTAIFTGKRSNANVTGETITVDVPGNVYVMPDYTGTIGSTGTPLKFDFNGAKTIATMNIEGSGKYYFSTDTTDNAITDLKVAIPSKASDACEIGGLVTNLYLIKGRCTLTSEFKSAASGIIEVSYQTSPANDSYLTASASADLNSNSATIVVNGGTCILSATTLASCTLRAQGGFTQVTDGEIDYIYIQGATVQYDAPGHKIDEMVEVFKGGRLDLTKSGEERTVDACRIHAGGVIDTRGVIDVITFTADPVLIGMGASFLQTGTQATAQWS